MPKKKPGYKTTEAWLTFGLAGAAIFQAFLGLDILDAKTTAALSGGLVAVYTVMRTLAKIRGAA